MKSCPKCMRVFPDDAGFCPADGSALQHASMVPIAGSVDDARLGSRLCGRYELRRVVADGGMRCAGGDPHRLPGRSGFCRRGG